MKRGEKGPVFVCHHGAGMTKESFELLARELVKRECQVVMFDCRGHGSNTLELDLSLETLSNDLSLIIDEFVNQEIVLVGHSMGAAVCIELLTKKQVKVIGLVCLDVVEGTAIESLVHMKSYLATRPEQFSSTQDAIDWAMRTKLLRNRESAEISIPSQLVFKDGIYVWRTDLKQSEKYWFSWFEGMSTKFLNIRGARLLILAGTDRLDKILTIGQMQGKFQLEIVNDSGHSIQEDVPQKLADLLVAFYQRNKPLDLSKIKKVS